VRRQPFTQPFTLWSARYVHCHRDQRRQPHEARYGYLQRGKHGASGIFLLALDHPAARGPINGTAHQPVTNREFGKALGRALHCPAFLPTPPWALRALLGEVAEVIATGQRVLPKQALALGYQFRFPNLDAALADILA
jgi:nucleoside-diphosphate-sugar epimerase